MALLAHGLSRVNDSLCWGHTHPILGPQPQGHCYRSPEKKVCFGGKSPDVGAGRPGFLPQLHPPTFFPEADSRPTPPTSVGLSGTFEEGVL